MRFPGCHLAAPLLALAVAAQFPADAAEAYRADPAKVLGAENCAECHASMVEAWKLTHHFDTFNTMHRRPEAREIASKLGMRRIKDESLCLKCHYTSQGAEGAVKAISGISCESCHGAGADWNKVHSNKDDPDRLKKGEKLGMLRPSNTYAVAANCFSCHSVPEEKLVNETEHKAGSDFELVAWSQGEVRHNLQHTEGKKNVEASPERKRMLYIVGRALDLEYGLRGMAKATQDGKYAQSMSQRVENAKSKLKAINDAAAVPEIKDMLAAAGAVQLKPGNGAELNSAAEKIAALAKQFASTQDGTKLAAIDALVPSSANYKGKPYQP